MAKRFQVHWAEFPLSDRIPETAFKPSLLLLLAHFQPILDENDPAINDVLFGDWTKFDKFPMLFGRAEAHHMFNAGTVVPTPVEQRNFSAGREVLHVPLHVYLGFLPVGWGGQGHNTKDPGTYPRGDSANRSSLPGAIAAFKDDDYSKPVVLDPCLKFAQLDLQPLKFVLIFTPLQRPMSFVMTLVTHPEYLPGFPDPKQRVHT